MSPFFGGSSKMGFKKLFLCFTSDFFNFRLLQKWVLYPHLIKFLLQHSLILHEKVLRSSITVAGMEYQKSHIQKSQIQVYNLLIWDQNVIKLNQNCAIITLSSQLFLKGHKTLLCKAVWKPLKIVFPQ